MFRFRSILHRIVFLHILAIGAVGVLMPVAAHMVLRSTAEALQAKILRERAAVIARYLEAPPGGEIALSLPPKLSALYERGDSAFVYAVVDERGRILFSSLPGRVAAFPLDARAGDGVWRETMREKSTYAGVSLPEEIGGRTVWVQVAQDLHHPDVIVDNIVGTFVHRVAWIIGAALLVLLGVDIIIVRDALRPLREASQNAQKIEPARLDLRLPVRNMPREALPLVKAVNQALDRLESGFRAQREFTADAAHELRTPLRVLRARVDLLPDASARSELQTDIERMSRVVGQIIEIAELENFIPNPGATADLQAVAADVVGFLAPLALSEGRSVGLSGADRPVIVKGSPETLFQAIRNLVENAIRHTPPGTTVEVDVAPSGSVCVLDHGPGVAEADREQVFRRFWRRDRRRTGNAGLGLSIVARIVEAHDGTIEIGAGPDGGATFTLSFHLAGPPSSA